MSNSFSNVQFVADVSGLQVLGKKYGNLDYESIGTTNHRPVRLEKSTWYFKAIDGKQCHPTKEFKIENNEHVVKIDTARKVTSDITFTSIPEGYSVWGKKFGDDDWQHLGIQTIGTASCTNTTWYFQARNSEKFGEIVEKKIVEDTTITLPT